MADLEKIPKNFRATHRHNVVPELDVEKWGPDNILTLKIAVEDPPKLTKSKKCYKFAHYFGKFKGFKVVTDDGVEREVRVFAYVYAKLSKAEVRERMKAEVAANEAANEPALV